MFKCERRGCEANAKYVLNYSAEDIKKLRKLHDENEPFDFKDHYYCGKHYTFVDCD